MKLASIGSLFALVAVICATPTPAPSAKGRNGPPANKDSQGERNGPPANKDSPPAQGGTSIASWKDCALRCKGDKENAQSCLVACAGGDANLAATIKKAVNSDRMPGNERIQAQYQAQMGRALEERPHPYDDSFTREQMNSLYADGSMKNPYTGAPLDRKPELTEKFKMSDYEGGGLRRDGSAPDKENRFANAKLGVTPKHAIVAIFDSMVNNNCDVQDPANPCFFKCLTRYEIGHDRNDTVAGQNDAFQDGQEIRVVPFNYPECECGEGTGTYAGKDQATTLTFSEATGNRTIEATYDGAKTITMKFVSLKLVTDIDCSATFKIYDAKNPRPIGKHYADGHKVMIDYGKIKPASELQKRMGVKVPEAGSDEAAEIKESHTSTFSQVLKESLVRELAQEASEDVVDGGRRRKNKNRQLGASVSSVSTAPEVAAALPTAYDTREAFPRCTPIVRDQGTCGSCWSFATSGVLTQRTCIANNNLDSNFVLSPQAMITCDVDCFTTSPTVCNNGCTGGYTSLAFENMVSAGSTPEHCVAYTSGAGADLETCGTKQESGSVMHAVANCELESTASDTSVKAAASYELSGEAEMMSDIYLNGPIQTSILLETDMYGYSSGIYECDTDTGDLGGHAVITVGWGEDAGVKYWIVQNSWGSSWGDSGFFKLRRGIDSCSIESYSDAVTARSGVTFEEDNAVQDVDANTSGAVQLTRSVATVAFAAAAAAGVFLF